MSDNPLLFAHRSPMNITHLNSWADAGIPGAEPVITCAAAVSRHGYRLKYPGLICVAILDGPRCNDPVPSDRYNTWPLECCS